MAAKISTKMLVLFACNVMIAVYIYFLTIGIVETRREIDANLNDFHLWRLLIGQSSNISFFGAYFLFQLIFIASSFRRLYNLYGHWISLNGLLAALGVYIAVRGGLSWDLIFPGI